ncbi:prolyl oligopeptidase family serine peptidase [Epilithonimonas sp. JDS]|uniref:prolyl oligopeptidase family serine peptidase n=1 Tax=Epilithonimonas sp. JDS TaxID=2902797 RepID=UPI001E5CF3E7|nr:prolyl oligopeptidase family serine peptidase [Epilithonimonas sp. JDS]MCD9854753.1 prolyl oligopeptidase family serine peptidase [Epilithonimonas sp. JDS]
MSTQEGIAEKNKFVFYTAAVAAGHCNDNRSAIAWLSQAQKNELVSKPEELKYIESDSAFVKLHQLPEWVEIITYMKESISSKQLSEDRLNKKWITSINENVANLKNKKILGSKPTFALYFTKIKDLKVPYLVYVPTKYDYKTPLKTVIYLHGGVVNTDKFNYENYQIQQEPIFSIGENLNAIVVYPFGKKDFGWVDQQEAFDNILTIVDQVQKDFKVDKKNIILGGMSNGGTATFYYASQKPTIFKGFYAMSADPNVLLSKIKFENISQGKKLISINAKDDTVYEFKGVENIYLKNKTTAKDWEFRSRDEGDHGFIYDPENGEKAFQNVIKELLEK